MILKRLTSEENSDFFNISSCITYDDILYNELHDLNIKVGEFVYITYCDGKDELIEIIDIEHLDGTIWVNVKD